VNLKRRELLKKLAAGVTLTVAVPSIIYSCKDESPGNAFAFEGKVLIVGAGISGIYTGYLLQQIGVDFKIIEASDKFGGRLQTESKFDDFPMELGGDEIIGINSSFYDFLLSKSVKLAEVPTSESFIIDGIPQFANNLLEDNEFQAAATFIKGLKDFSGIDQSIDARVTQAGISTRVMHVIDGKIGNHYGTTNDKLGSLGVAGAINTSETGSEVFRIVGSDYTNFIKIIFSSVIKKIEFDAPVSSINYSGEMVEITDIGGNVFTGDMVVVTVPVSILKDGDITFTPSLSAEKQAALSTIGMDPGMKVFLRFTKNFWGETTSSVFAAGSAPEYISSGLNRGDRNKVLTALINGEKALTLGEMEDNAIISLLIRELDEIYGGAVASVNFIEGMVKNWTKEPYIRGAYSFPNVGSLSGNRSIIAQPASNKLFFAGEATNVNGNFGTIHGAVETAERVVDEIVAVLEPA